MQWGHLPRASAGTNLPLRGTIISIMTPGNNTSSPVRPSRGGESRRAGDLVIVAACTRSRKTTMRGRCVRTKSRRVIARRPEGIATADLENRPTVAVVASEAFNRGGTDTVQATATAGCFRQSHRRQDHSVKLWTGPSFRTRRLAGDTIENAPLGAMTPARFQLRWLRHIRVISQITTKTKII